MSFKEEKIDFSEYKWYIISTFNTLKARTTLVNDEKNKIKKLEILIKSENMEEYFEEIFIPITLKKDIYTQESKEINLAPGYIFIKMNLTGKVKLFLMNSKIGFLIGGYTKPTIMSEEKIQKMKNNIENYNSGDGMFSVGEAVKITNRDFADFDGVITELFEDSANVSISIFGRHTVIKFKITELEKIIS
jgi:transcription antitermination factor NusG